MKQTKRLIALLALTPFTFLSTSCSALFGLINKQNKKEEVTIKEQSVFYCYGIEIIAKELNMEGTLGPEIKFYFINNSDWSITVQARDTVINGYSIDSSLSTNVVAGTKAYDNMFILKSDLETANISRIEYIEFTFHIFDSDTFNTIKDSSLIRINTSAYRDN